MRRIFGLLTTAIGLSACITSQYADGYAAYQRGDCATALRNWQQLASRGDRFAQNGIGVMYDAGRCVPQDSVEAAKWFRRSAAKGNEIAQYNLGRSYDLGKGVPQNYAEALRLYKLSADQGYAEAQRALGALISKAANTETNTPPETPSQRRTSSATTQTKEDRGAAIGPVLIDNAMGNPGQGQLFDASARTDLWGNVYPEQCRKDLTFLIKGLTIVRKDLGYNAAGKGIGYWWHDFGTRKTTITIDISVTDQRRYNSALHHELCHELMWQLNGDPYWHRE